MMPPLAHWRLTSSLAASNCYYFLNVICKYSPLGSLVPEGETHIVMRRFSSHVQKRNGSDWFTTAAKQEILT
ncbi:hypothetical protein E2C01_023440 [Portunus trituberculatus]|uniref:Uncharacterized protein n=1 Tax=Portunus trituberculatus TaxID=210409 RepID=A0A5B7E7Y8_PORTR|nr:hypothetical protein [Portunus trituberculatus]